MKNMRILNNLLIVLLVFVFTISFASAIGCDNDGVCEAGENAIWCYNDCGFGSGCTCGDGVCDASEQGNCPADCGTSCTPTNGGVEKCDGVDNDCDGLIDEGFPLICKSTPTNTSLSILTTASQSFNIFVSNSTNNISIKWYNNEIKVSENTTSYNFVANPDTVGIYNIKVVVNNTLDNQSMEKEWQLNVTNPSWLTFWGRVTDAETGMPAPGKKLSFYLDSEIESKYSNVEQLESYTYSTWQALVPKLIPDYRTNAEGYFFTNLANGIYNYIIEGSREDEMEVKVSASHNHQNSTISQPKMIMPKTGYIKVYFESASAGLKSDLYLGSPVNVMAVPNSTVGMSYVTNNTYANGTELKLYILVHGTSWGLGEYKHWSNDSTYAKIEQLDSDTWRVRFEDLPANQADFDFNDVVATIDIIDAPNPIIPPADCDNDGIPNWQDTNDSWCDTGDNSSALVNFNADGHILYGGGDYAESNNYTCGQTIRFLMFGNNSGTLNETVTFAIQNHAGNENSNASMIYIGNLSNSAEILTVSTNGSAQKRFDWQVPCSPMPANGHYDIHISHDGDNLWRKIGDFYIIPDTTAPMLNVFGPYQIFRNQQVSAGYWAGDPPQPGSMPDLVMQIQVISNIPDTSVRIEANKDFVNHPDVVDATGYGGNQAINFTYNESGVFTLRLTAIDASGNEAYRDVNVTVWITEEDADAIALPIYTLFGLTGVGWQTNYYAWINSSSPVVNANWDRYNNAWEIGDEYLTPGNNLTSEGAVSNHDAIAFGLNNEIDTCSGQPYMNPISPLTAMQYNQTIYNYLYHLKCVCGRPIIGPAC